MSLAVAYMLWLLVLTAVCLLLAELLHQTAKSSISNTTQELIQLLSPHKFWRYVQHSAKAAAVANKVAAVYQRQQKPVLCQGHQDWLFGLGWLTDRHLVTGMG